MGESEVVRASDAERDDVVERLHAATVEGRLTLEELTGRIDAAWRATTKGELATITADLPEPRSTAPPPSPPRTNRMVSVFGDTIRDGAWRPGEQVSAVSVFGDVDLDLRKATAPAGDLRVDATAPFGGIDVIVPEGVEVEVSGFSLFGSKRIEAAGGGAGAPVVRVRAFSIFGRIKVWSP